MKRGLILIIFLILIQTSLAVTLSQDGIEHYHGREIKVVAIIEGQAIISVDDEKNIFSVGEEKEINGVKVKLDEIFYANELSTVNLNLSLTYECGDNVCDEWENSAICCKDCPCATEEKCVDNSCIIPECLEDTDCNDNSDLTNDYCEDYKCKFKQIKCKKDSDCDDNDPDTDDICKNGRCSNILNYICKEDIDCDDQNKCTEDLCINKDCQYRQIENCKEEIKKEAKEIEESGEETKVGFFRKLLNWFKNLF